MNDFILVVDWTHNKIYQVSLLNSEVRGFDSDMIQNTDGLEYNHFTRKVIWGDTGDYLLQQANLDGTDYEVLVDVGMYNARPDRMAIDYSTGNIFYTAVRTDDLGFSGIAVVTPDGVHKKIVEYGQKPRAIALDPEQGIMFWTDHGTTPAVLMRANMDGSDMAIVYDKIVWPNGVAISRKVNTVFVTDGHASSNRIYACTFNGLCSMFHEDPGAHLMDIKLLDDFLFYSAWNKVYITRLDIHTKEVVKFAENAELGRLDAIAVYSSTLSVPVSSNCSPNNGRANCSTFCLPKFDGYTCACANGVSLLSDGKTCSDVSITTTETTTPITSTTNKITATKSTTTVQSKLTTRTASTARTTTSSLSRFSTSWQESPTDVFKGATMLPYIGVGAGGALVLIVAIVIVCAICFVRKRKRADDRTRYLNDTEGFDNTAVFEGDSVNIRGLKRHQYEPSQSASDISEETNQEYSVIHNDDYLHFPQRDSMYDVIPADITQIPPYEASRMDHTQTLPETHFHTLPSTAEVSALPYLSNLPAAGTMHANSLTKSGDSFVGSDSSEDPSKCPYITGREPEETCEAADKT
ncbi:LRP4-like protein [Mya arenaria]|uniref:LRP4-like protein n=1 Tax=Mya arenaria TaxID=6604 RepID=A0ABY7FSW1_MYAAR|nr:LRP4-like protein [Mya arenaria]